MEKMLGKMEGAAEYRSKGNQRMVAAFTTMSFKKISWVIVTNESMDEVAAFVSENFKDTIALLSVVALILGLAFFSAYGNYRRRVDGEMEMKRLRENQKLMEELRRNRETAERLTGEMVVIAEIGRVISSSLDINEVYKRFADETRKLIPVDRIDVSLQQSL